MGVVYLHFYCLLLYNQPILTSSNCQPQIKNRYKLFLGSQTFYIKQLTLKLADSSATLFIDVTSLKLNAFFNFYKI